MHSKNDCLYRQFFKILKNVEKLIRFISAQTFTKTTLYLRNCNKKMKEGNKLKQKRSVSIFSYFFFVLFQNTSIWVQLTNCEPKALWLYVCDFFFGAIHFRCFFLGIFFYKTLFYFIFLALLFCFVYVYVLFRYEVIFLLSMRC